MSEEIEAVENEAVENETTEPDTFDRDYVEKLRAEAAEHRVKAKEAQDALDASVSAYRALAVQHAATGILSRPDALGWRDDWTAEDGIKVDLDAIREAATEYADRYPHTAVVAGDVGQGYRGESASSVDLAGMLRAGA